jgi:hypothetical protein
VKRTEALRLWEAVHQATRDALPKEKIPVVAHRRNHEEWIVILPAKEFLKLWKAKILDPSTSSNDQSNDSATIAPDSIRALSNS